MTIRSWVTRNRGLLSAVVVLAVLALSMVAIRHLASEVQPGQIRRTLAMLPHSRIALALLFTGCSYALLTLYDVIALRVVGQPQPYRVAALASFTSYALSHNIGFSWLTGGSARLRIYGVVGLGPGDVARVIALAGISFWLGVIVLVGAGLLIEPGLLGMWTSLAGPGIQKAIGIALLAGAAAWLAYSASGRRLRLRHISLPLPGFRLTAVQFLVSALDISFATAALAVLLPHGTHIDFPLMVVVYAISIVGGLVTHVPGGVGVFEALMLLLLPDIPAGDLLPALLAYRLIYYVLPLTLAAAALLAHEGIRLRRPAMMTVKGIGAVSEYIAPSVAAILAFLAGLVLLVSAALPALPDRLAALHKLMPLPLIEISHFGSSLIGTALVLFAPALYRRLDGAFLFVRVLLVAGIAVSLAKGFDWEEALVLAFILALLGWARPAFYRRTRLLAEPLSPGWVGAAAAGSLVAVAIGFFTYKHLPYDDSLWWTFTLHGNGPRFLRALLGLGVGATAFFVWHGFAPANADEGDPLPPDTLARAFASGRRSDAWLALTGDKDFLVAPEGDAFLMYRRHGRSWIAIGDPVGPQSRWPDLMWRLRELADRNQGRVLFYQLSPDALPFAVDLGLNMLKYGEEAQLALENFVLDGPAMKSMRGSVRKLEREGGAFEVLPVEGAAPVMDELQALSDAWLASKHGREKGFSVGRFDRDYLLKSPIAIVRREGSILAFANIWATPGREELSIDLMRHLPGAPNGTMDFLLVSLFRWGRDHGYACFNLGLAPLSGLEARRLAPAWAKLGHFLYRHGEDIYGFGGLRAYKEKFRPEWQPRYIAGPAGLPLARALADLVQLVSR